MDEIKKKEQTMRDTIYRDEAVEAVIKWYGCKPNDIEAFEKIIEAIPSADRPPKVVAQVTFDEEKLREIVKKAVERFKEEYEIADRPQGEWIEVDDYFIRCKCSICGWESHKYEDDVYGMPYCPNCGAKMKKIDNEIF